MSDNNKEPCFFYLRYGVCPVCELKLDPSANGICGVEDCDFDIIFIKSLISKISKVLIECKNKQTKD